MLTAIREGSKGWISAIIIGAIVLTFALFGISSYLEGGEQVPVATVNGAEIDNYVYQNQVAQQRQSMLSRFGGSIDPAILDSLGIREQVLDRLIENQLVQQYTEAKNFRITDAQLSSAIVNNPTFHTDGKFDPELYQRVIATNGYSPQAFEAIERQNRMATQLESAISDTAFSIGSEYEVLAKLQTQQREAQFAVLPAATYIDEFEISDEEARKHYEENTANYRNPARIKIEYIDLNLEQMAVAVEPSEDDISQTYDRLKGQLTQPEVRKASHILFAMDGDADDAAKDAVRKKAEEVLEQINSGSDFSELAKEHSEDPGSAINGGDLGVVTRGQMVAPFEEAVFSMSLDEVSGLVETQFGVHLIKLTELTPQRQKTLDEVREDMTREAARSLAEATFADLIDPLENLVFEQPDTLEAAADETGLSIETSDWFTESNGEGIAAEAAIRRAAFAPDVRDDGLNSPVIDLGFERMVALRKLEYEDASDKAFDEVRESIIADLRLKKSREKLAMEAPTMLEGLSHIASWDIMLAKNELDNQSLPPVRNEIEPTLSALADAVYKTKASEDGRPAYGHVEMPDGDIALFALTSVVEEEVAQDDPALVRIKQQLEARDGRTAYRGFLSQLRNEAEVVVVSEQL